MLCHTYLDRPAPENCFWKEVYNNREKQGDISPHTYLLEQIVQFEIVPLFVSIPLSFR